MNENLDLLDKKILYELDLNSRASISKIAKKVNSALEIIVKEGRQRAMNEYN